MFWVVPGAWKVEAIQAQLRFPFHAMHQGEHNTIFVIH